MLGGMKGGNAERLGSRPGEEQRGKKMWTSPRKIQALSLYSECQDTLSATPSWTSRSFSSLISFTLVKGLRGGRAEKRTLRAAWPEVRESKTKGLIFQSLHLSCPSARQTLYHPSPGGPPPAARPYFFRGKLRPYFIFSSSRSAPRH